MLFNRKLLLFLYLILIVVCVGGCSNAPNAKYYKATFLEEKIYKGIELEQWIHSDNKVSGYYQLINSDPDSWETVIYYPNINSDLRYIYYTVDLKKENGDLKIYLTERDAVNDSDVVKDLVLHISAPIREVPPTSSEVFINNQKVECLDQKNVFKQNKY